MMSLTLLIELQKIWLNLFNCALVCLSIPSLDLELGDPTYELWLSLAFDPKFPGIFFYMNKDIRDWRRSVEMQTLSPTFLRKSCLQSKALIAGNRRHRESLGVLGRRKHHWDCGQIIY